MNKKLTILFAAMLFLGFQATAQMQITGKVTGAEDRLSIPGVSIVVKDNTTIGTTTNIDGEYSLTVPSNAEVLIFSFVGMKTQELIINGRSIIDVAMESETLEMDEVVVVAYGTMTKEKLTGSVKVIKADVLEKVPAASFQHSLQGKVAGLRMTSTDGQPGSNNQIRIRGIGSIEASGEPLYVIDGIPVENTTTSSFNFDNGDRSSSTMNTINPNDIESVSVLKDASSTAIYGSRGANGVIIITTKSGRKGQSIINFTSQLGFSSEAYNNLLEPLNAGQYKELYIEGYVNSYHGLTEAQAITQFESTYGVGTYTNTPNSNWLDEITRTGKTQQHNLSARGGNDKITYFASLSNFDQEGTIIGSAYERYSARLNLSVNVTEKLKITNNMSFSYADQDGVIDGSAWSNPIYNSIFLPPVVPVRNDDGTFYGDHQYYGIMGGNNPVGALSGDDERWMKTSRYTENLSVSYEIIENLIFKSTWGVDYINIHDFEYKNGRYGDARNVGGSIDEGHNTSLHWTGTQTLNYQKTLNDHNLNLLLGYEALGYTRRELYAYGEGFPNDQLRTLASAANPLDAYSEETNYTFQSIFSRVNYSYLNKYNLSTSYRRDGSSRFGTDNRYGNFWSIGASWSLSNESFMSGLSNIVNNLKLRTSYGTSGNANIGNFKSLGLFRYSGYDYAGESGGVAYQIGNPSLTWEKQKILDVGVNLGLFSRVNAAVTYYSRVNSDLLLDRPISLTVGSYAPEVAQNSADMVNSGFEFEFDVDILQGDFNWNVGFNLTTSKNEITKLDEPLSNSIFHREEGHDYYEFYFYHWAGVNPADGTPQWYTDETETTISSDYTDIERYHTGKSALPKAFGGINTELSYKGITFSASAASSWGNYIYDNQARFYMADGRYAPRSTSTYAYENRWKNPGDETTFPRWIWNAPDRGYSYPSTRYLFDGTYIRLRDVTLSYDIPKNLVTKIKLSSLKIFMKGSNLYTWTKDKDLYLDPEQSISGIYAGIQPALKTITFGIDVSF